MSNNRLMTLNQQAACLHWAEAMLSGNYKHGKGMLYNHETDSHSAAGVAMASEHWPTNDDGYFVDPKDIGWQSDREWFDTTFGLPRDADLYTTLNNMSKNYLNVVALVLDAVPDKNPTKALIHKQFMEEVNANYNSKAKTAARG